MSSVSTYFKSKTIPKHNGQKLTLSNFEFEGNNNEIWGNYVIGYGTGNIYHGDYNEGHGGKNTFYGKNCSVYDNNNTIYCDESNIYNSNNNIYGNENVIHRKLNTVSGNKNIFKKKARMCIVNGNNNVFYGNCNSCSGSGNVFNSSWNITKGPGNTHTGVNNSVNNVIIPSCENYTSGTNENENSFEILKEKHLIKDNEASEKGLQCIVCLNYERKLLYLPCKHNVSCFGCFYKYYDMALKQKKELNCPICKEKVNDAIEIFN